MKVSKTGSGSVSKSTATRKGARATNKNTGAKVDPAVRYAGLGQSDAVEVNNHLETLDLIRDLVAESPDIRMDQVEAITQRLKGGKYKIDFAKVAEGFIKEAILTEISRKPRKK